eukprot:4789648-Pleurochrysis_carterae.AAC.1
MGLTGALSTERQDEWHGGAPSRAAQKCVAELRAAFRARVLEATDARRTETALTHFADFTASTQRVPFVDPASEGGIEYNVETLGLFAEFLRRPDARRRGGTDGAPYARAR